MNGRCETDPLDAASDVCDRCYGEFCENHLVKPAGRRHPYCTQCARDAAAVRGNKKIEYRGARKTAKERRAALKAAGGSSEEVFQYFDARTTNETADEESPTEPQPDPEAEPSSTTDGNESAPTAQRGRSGRGKRARRRKSAKAPEPAPADAVAPEEPADGEDGGAGSPSTEGEADDGRTTPAMARLRELRKTGGPKPQPATPVAKTDGVADRDPADAAPAPAATRATSASRPRERAAADGAKQGPQPRRRRATDREASPGASRASRKAPPSTPPPETAPMIGEIRKIGGRRSDDRSRAATTSTPPADGDPRSNPAALDAIEESGAERRSVPTESAAADPAPTRATAPTPSPSPTPGPGASGERSPDPSPGSEPTPPADNDRADIDANGNWIPPILRGFAADAKQAKSDLPKRRSS